MRLDLFLASNLADESRSSVAKAIAEGRVTVNGKIQKASYKVQAGEVIRFLQIERSTVGDLEPIDIPLDVPYEDEYLLVVDKPAGLATHPSPTSHEPTLVNALIARSGTLSTHGGTYRPGIVHRLDKGTSGLLLVAKTDVVHRRLQAAIQRRKVHRVYWAWVRGKPQQEEFVIRSFIGRHPKDRLRQAVLTETTPGARLAITNCRLLESRNCTSKVECRLETGRTHQIRVHLSAVGLPILGDPLYGVPFEGLTHQALHAVSLEFAHPVYGATITVEAPLPEDLASVD